MRQVRVRPKLRVKKAVVPRRGRTLVRSHPKIPKEWVFRIRERGRERTS